MELRRWVIVAMLAIALLASPAIASARAVTSDQYDALLRRAPSDPRAVVELRRVTRVDGKPVNIERALAGAHGEELADRLRALADGEDAPHPTADASALARSILARPEFRRQGEDGVAAGLRRLFAPIRDWISEAIARMLTAPVLVVLAGLVVVASAVTAARIARDRAKAAAVSRRYPAAVEPEDAAALERSADDAERRGDLEQALRLRFRAALLRLAERGLIEFSVSLTSGQLARRLRSPTFDAASKAFDEVVYGRRYVEPADLEVVRRIAVDVPREAAA